MSNGLGPKLSPSVCICRGGEAGQSKQPSPHGRPAGLPQPSPAQPGPVSAVRMAQTFLGQSWGLAANRPLLTELRFRSMRSWGWRPTGQAQAEGPDSTTHVASTLSPPGPWGWTQGPLAPRGEVCQSPSRSAHHPCPRPPILVLGALTGPALAHVYPSLLGSPVAGLPVNSAAAQQVVQCEVQGRSRSGTCVSSIPSASEVGDMRRKEFNLFLSVPSGISTTKSTYQISKEVICNIPE